jgi:tRNA pseudouridine38-40 synthase
MQVDPAVMQLAANKLIGTHNFKPFSAERGDEPVEDPVRTLHRLEIQTVGPALHIIAEADGFLYKMVRSLVGTLVEIGRGKVDLHTIDPLLAHGERTAAVVTAPAAGLCLEKVDYPSHLCCKIDSPYTNFY